jgi:hypothetical protein
VQNNASGGASPGILRGGVGNEESTEYAIASDTFFGQRSNVHLVRDLRSRITLYNGARNEQMPPWLWWENQRLNMVPSIFDDYVFPDQLTQELIERRFLTQARQKIDLREMDGLYYAQLSNAAPPSVPWPLYEDAAAAYPFQLNPYTLTNELLHAGRLNMRERLPATLLIALTDGSDELEADRLYGSYYGLYRGEQAIAREWDMVTGANDVFADVYTAAKGNFAKTRRLAAAYSSNILGYRTNKPWTLTDSIFLLPEFTANPDKLNAGTLNPGSTVRTGYLPVEAQPFLVEAFIGHVYKRAASVPLAYINPQVLRDMGLNPTQVGCDPTVWEGLGIDPEYYANPGDIIILDQEPDPLNPAVPNTRSTIVAIQIANPFDVPIDLRNYRLGVMGGANPGLATHGNAVNLEEVFIANPSLDPWLYPARDGMPSTMVFYAMESHLAGDPDGSLRARWRQFFDIDITGGGLSGVASDANSVLPPGTVVVDVSNWIEVRRRKEQYDQASVRGNITLMRRDESFTSQPLRWVEVDRFDVVEFDQADSTAKTSLATLVKGMDEYRPMRDPRDPTDPSNPDTSLLLCHVPPTATGYYPAYTLEAPVSHWVQWVRVTRAWGVDLNGNGVYEAHESNPRYVFGDRALVVPTNHGTPNAGSRFSRARELEKGGAIEFNHPEPTPANDDAPGANVYVFADNPNGANPGDPPWFARTYYNSFGDLVDGSTQTSGRTPGVTAGTAVLERKPTFFALGWKDGSWSGVNSNDPRRAYFMPDKGWYGQFKVDLKGQAISHISFKTVGHGWGRQGVNTALTEVSGVDDPTILFDDGTYQTQFRDTSIGITWSTPPLPLFRQPYSMQMTLKNKISIEHFTDPSTGTVTLPGWFTNLPTEQRDELLYNRDFEQVGELLNVWLFGHEVQYQSSTPHQVSVLTTFSEHMSGSKRPSNSTTDPQYYWQLTGGTPIFNKLTAAWENKYGTAYERYLDWLADPDKSRINRLRLKPVEIAPPDSGEDPTFLGDIIGRPRFTETPTNPGLCDYACLFRTDVRQAMPALPAGVRLLDVFVCDGPGAAPWETYELNTGNVWGSLSYVEQNQEIERLRFFNANAFAGKMTPGLVNINTASLEVLRTLPHLSRLVHELSTNVGSDTYQLADNPFPRVARAMALYRERLGDPTTAGIDYSFAGNSFNLNHGPAYAHRGRDRDWFRPGEDVNSYLRGVRGDRGFASIGELMLLNQPGRIGKFYTSATDPWQLLYGTPGNAQEAFDAIDFNNSWRIDYAGMPDRRAYEVDQAAAAPATKEVYLFGYSPTSGELPPDNLLVNQTSTSARISTDTVDVIDLDAPVNAWNNNQPYHGYFAPSRPDDVAEDAHESNLLFAGLSNMVTTRSDVFTVYFRIRSFRQNPITGKWDATDPDYIVDDSRYVMLVDRSEVNKPSDKPKILYLEKLPK